MVAGISFPDIYEWTWGEIVDFIVCKNEADIERGKAQAMMDFKLSNLIARMVMGKKGMNFNIMDEYNWLWTDEDRKQAKLDKIMKSLHLDKGDNNNGR